MSISFAPELGDAVREAAERARKLCPAAGNNAPVIGC